MKTLTDLMVAALLALASCTASADYFYADPDGDSVLLTNDKCTNTAIIKALVYQGQKAGVPEKRVIELMEQMKAGVTTIDGKQEPNCWAVLPGGVVMLHENGEVIVMDPSQLGEASRTSN